MAFILESARELEKRLGFDDSIIELNELAIRELIRESNSKHDVTQYISHLSDHHGIIVNFPSLPERLGSMMAESYIVRVYTNFELFLYEFKREANELFGIEIKFIDGESKLKRSLDKLKGDPSLTSEIMEYYRLARNKIVHPKSRNKDISGDFNKISTKREMIKSEFIVTYAPHEFDSLDFEDFILFTKASKKMAFELCTLLKPSNEKIIKSLDLKSLKKLMNNTSRLTDSVKGSLRTKYSISDTEVDSVLQDVDLLEIMSNI